MPIKPTLFVISAPSGAGKTTLIKQIKPIFPDMKYSISCTTRNPRRGEIDSVSYYFISESKFKSMSKAGEFLEWKNVHGNLYGTPAKPVLDALKSGQRMIMDIDVEGAKEVFSKMPQAIGIFINAPSLEVLEKRLRMRKSDSEESIRIRMLNAFHEIRMSDLFKHRIVNDDLKEAAKELVEIIRKESQIE
ncbi:MAG: guanylate kinase [Syntrophaceae bacterium]|nr:guanylate kinase [Syntrophaceae bacterium]